MGTPPTEEEVISSIPYKLKKSEHLNWPYKQLDNQEDKVGSDVVKMGADGEILKPKASPRPSPKGEGIIKYDLTPNQYNSQE